MERCLSGLKRRFAKPLYGGNPVPRVRIPPSPFCFAPFPGDSGGASQQQVLPIGEAERRCEAPLGALDGGREAGQNAAAKLHWRLLDGGSEAGRHTDMYTVYILRSTTNPDRLYIGLTSDLQKRLKTHNGESSTYSKRYSPWELEIGISLKDKKTAEDLEKYFKSGSGFAFLKKRMLSQVKSGEWPT